MTIAEEYDEIKQYAKTNKLKINEVKTNEIIFSNARNGIVTTPVSSYIVHCVKLLGVFIDNSAVLVTCNQRFYLLKVLHGMPVSCLHTIYMSIIVNKILYCLSV